MKQLTIWDILPEEKPEIEKKESEEFLKKKLHIPEKEEVKDV